MSKADPKAYLKDELFAEWGVSNRQGERMLTKAVTEGLLIAEWVTFTDRTGRPNRRPVYRTLRSVGKAPR